MGTLAGPVVGAAFVVILATMLADYYAIQVVITGVILILVIRFAPLGIWGTFRGLPWARRIAARLTSPAGEQV
jgi:ABC-type branched-subunit amino acid transport system permease subunit